MPADRLAWIDDEFETLESLDLRRSLRLRSGVQGPTVTIDNQQVVNFGSNDYLGLAADARIAAAVRDALDGDRYGSGASPLIVGRSDLHDALERELARFEQTEAALVFPSGFAANVGAITALASRGDIIFSDAKNHASIVDGCRLSGARVQVYPHADVDYLNTMIGQAKQFRRRLIVTDTLFSMDGDFAPLVELVDLAQANDCMLMVDEAHATGVFGEGGRGVAELLGVEDRIDIRVGTMSKALGCAGGFVAGSQALIDWLANRARTYVFSTAPPDPWCAAALAAVKIVEQQPERRARLLTSANKLAQGLREQGWQLGDNPARSHLPQSQIIPVFLGEPALTIQFADALLAQGIFVPGIRPPSVPEGESLLRISVSSAHTDEHFDCLMSAMGEIRSGFRSTD